MKVKVLLILFTFLLLCNNSCQINTEPNQSQRGYISVLVIDDIVGPLENVAIYIAPDSILKVTEQDGKVLFKLNVGNYYVDADVCCIGPGFIKFHLPVKVVKNDTLKVELKACLLCL